MKELSSWHPIRWIFLLVGIAIAVFAYLNYDAALGMLAVFLIYQAIANVGCVKTCYAWQRRLKKSPINEQTDSDEIIYEEIL